MDTLVGKFQKVQLKNCGNMFGIYAKTKGVYQCLYSSICTSSLKLLTSLLLISVEVFIFGISRRLKYDSL